VEDLDLTDEELRIETLGPARIDSPLELSTTLGDHIANFAADEGTVLLSTDRTRLMSRIEEKLSIPAFEAAGPRNRIYFDPSKTRAAVVTCGGLCPGINNVIRSLVMELHYRYRVHTIYGIRYGFRGFVPKYGYEPVMLEPSTVHGIIDQGGSFLASSRGPQDTAEIVDCLERMNVSLLFLIGGDGTLRGGLDIHEEARRRGLKIAVIGIPKTIDNDICYVEKTFGLETAFSVAADAIKAVHTEAIGAPNGIGLVKVMGRMSGSIAANAALAMSEVNFVLVPEVPFDLEGPRGLFAALEARLRSRAHAVILVAEGAGQDLVGLAKRGTDESGNPSLGDVGVLLREAIKSYFKKNTDLYVNLKYIDPSYLIRSVKANAHDAIYCMQLAQNAVHAGMAGKTGMIVGQWNGQFTHVPIRLAVSRKKQLSPDDPLWLNVMEATGQPALMKNG
jgi:6-phosphofructokinase 1